MAFGGRPALGPSTGAVAWLPLGRIEHGKQIYIPLLTMVACQQPVPLHDARFSDWHFSESKGRVQVPCASLGRYRLPYKVPPAAAFLGSLLSLCPAHNLVPCNSSGCFTLTAEQI